MERVFRNFKTVFVPSVCYLKMIPQKNENILKKRKNFLDMCISCAILTNEDVLAQEVTSKRWPIISILKKC